MTEELAAFEKEHGALADRMQAYTTKLDALMKEQDSLKDQFEKHKAKRGKLEKTHKDQALFSKLKQDETQWARMLPRPGNFFVSLFLGALNVHIFNKSESVRFKEEYELFKKKLTPIFFAFCLVVYLAGSRRLDMVLQAFLVYYYLCLALRENILSFNGSNIKSWWVRHHYISMLLCLIMMTWPSGEWYRSFRVQFVCFVFYTGLLQILQTQYQMHRMYKLRTLGEINMMDVANTDSTQINWAPDMNLLLFFVFGAQAFQLVNSYVLFSMVLEGAEWQAAVIGLIFAVLAIGNLSTTITILYQKKRTASASHSE